MKGLQHRFANNVPKMLFITYDGSISGNMGRRRLRLYLEPLLSDGWHIDYVFATAGSNLEAFAQANAANNSSSGHIRLIRVFPGLSGTVRKSVRGEDPGLIDHVSSGQEPMALLLRFFRAGWWAGCKILIPDDRIDWLPFAVWRIRRLRTQRYNVIFSYGFPWSVTLVGYIAKLMHGCPWIVDVAGEVWGVSTRLPKWRRPLDRGLEGRVLARADAVITAGAEIRDAYASAYGEVLQGRVYEIGFGFDPRRGKELLADCEAKETFDLVHTGIIYAGLRLPKQFFEALARLGDLKKLRFLHSGRILTEVRRSHCFQRAVQALGERFKDLGWIPEESVVQLQLSSTVLIAFMYEKFALPVKLFEYLGVGKPILAVKIRDDDPVARLFDRNRWAWMVSSDAGEIERAIRACYQMWERGTLTQMFSLEGRESLYWSALGERAKGIVRRIAGVCTSDAQEPY